MGIFSALCSYSTWTVPGRFIVYHLAHSRPVLTHKIIRFLQGIESKNNPFFLRLPDHNTNHAIIRGLSRDQALETAANIVGAFMLPPTAAFMFYPVWSYHRSTQKILEQKIKLAKENREFYVKLRKRVESWD